MDAVRVSPAERLAMWGSTAAIAVLVLLQAPGRILPETKLDVLLDPLGFLGRALDAWDPAAGFGRTQNQAAGYLFPMGAFSALGRALGLSPWLVQRAWIALIISLALWGAHRVARAVGISSAGGRVGAAWVYALAPALLSLVAFQSAGQLPYALAPHVLVPLLTMREGDAPRRVAGRSALWVAAMGGVNGASVIAVLPLVAVWFATRTPGPLRRRLMAWWTAGVVAATLWWLIPLAVTVRYGVRFTDYTETAALTTSTESATEILRGTDNWLSYLVSGSGLWLPGSWALASDRLAIIGSMAIAGIGLWGLSRREAPGRSWLIPSLVLGSVLMGAGYVGAGGGAVDEPFRALLDGALAPFRNVHKFAAMVRLPIALGVGHAIVVAARALRRRSDLTMVPRLAPVAAMAITVLAIAPAFGGPLAAPGSFTDIPDSWRRTAAWLNDNNEGQRALIIPGAPFGEYEWGRPLDEPLSALGVSSWAVRDLIPLGGNGSTRLLDGIDAALAQGDLPPGFTQSLQRSGVGSLVVRNDLDRDRTGGPSPADVRRLLAQDPSLTLATSFGEVVEDPGNARRQGPRPGAATLDIYQEIDIYTVPNPSPVAEAYALDQAAVIEGGPEALLSLDPEVLAGRASVLAVDPGAGEVTGALVVATDTARRRDVRFGSIRGNVSYTLTADADSPLDGAAPVDRWPADEPRGLTVADVEGAAALSQSPAPGRLGLPEDLPFAAFDADPASSWVAWPDETGAWLQVDLDQPTGIGPVTVEVPSVQGRHISAVTVETDQGTETVPVDREGRATAADVAGSTEVVRVTVAEVGEPDEPGDLALSAVEIDGIEISRPLVLPEAAEDGPAVVALARAHRDRFETDRGSEDLTVDRRFTWAGDPMVQLTGTAEASPGLALDAALAASQPQDVDGIRATASSRWRGLPAHRAEAAIDADPMTAWVSDPEAGAPQLDLAWTGPALIDGLRISGPDAIGDVTVVLDGQRLERTVGGDGQIDLPPTTTDRLTLEFTGTDDRPLTQVVVAEVEIPGLFGRAAAGWDRATEVIFACGDGPDLTIDGRTVDTGADTTVGALLDGSAVRWASCDEVELSDGPHRLIADDNAGLQVNTATILPADGLEPAPAPRPIAIGSWEPDRRVIQVQPGEAAIVATTENFNQGWEATADGQTLTPIRVDGWRQGWIVPAGQTTTITARYQPATAQRLGLALGLGALLALVLAAALPARSRDGTDDQHETAALSARVTPRWAGVVLVAVAGVSLGGPLVLLGLPIMAVAWRTRWLWAVGAGALAVAGVVVLVQAGAPVGSSEGTFSALAQAGAVVAVMGVAASLVPAKPHD